MLSLVMWRSPTPSCARASCRRRPAGLDWDPLKVLAEEDQCFALADSGERCAYAGGDVWMPDDFAIHTGFER